MNKKLYPCVAYFDSNTENYFRKFQNDVFKLTGSKACLEEWRPHITVGKALKLDKTQFVHLLYELEKFEFDSFEVEINGFGFMDDWKGSTLFNCQPYVIYANVVMNSKLSDFVEILDLILKKYNFSYDIFPYNPHLTLAFKDLDKEGFEKAKNYFKNKELKKIIKIKSFFLATDLNKKNVFEEIQKFNLK